MPDVRPRLLQAREQIEQGRLAQARQTLQRALQQAPNDRNAQVLMRFTLARLGEHQQALYYAQEALKHDPADPNLLTNVGNSLGECGRESEAIDYLRKAARANPRHIESRLSLAPALLRG
jgi:Tfp pilus assembly protein PilF